ncbi:MAG: ribosome small subunit-dependent GTPase A [Propionibacteriaceae bacterium]|jgi:ribosome biogenesis GTPase|nr:ribosome small subunit-dependent GTPase A [Propionibacteriaceae bacterium]
MRRTSGSWFEEDVDAYGRPPKRTRPRTKDRPDYSQLPLGRVLSIDRGRFRLLVDGQAVTASKARSLGRKSVIVGDQVRVDGDVSGQVNSLARITEVEPRRSVLRRTADDADPFERPIVANADQLVIVTALADPEPRLGMIDRVLVAGLDAGLHPILCLTKADLATPESLLSIYQPLGVDIFITEPDADLSVLSARLAGHVSVFVGHSGVGKSTLVNRLIPQADRPTGDVNQVTGKGRHTSTSAIALPLPGADGWVIDTPGVRSFGLNHISDDQLLAAFPEIAAVAAECPRGCSHQSSNSDCCLDQAASFGLINPARLESYRRLCSPDMV